MNRSEAQARANRIQAFRDELAELEREQALRLTLEQRATLDAHLDSTLERLRAAFDIDTTAGQSKLSWGMRIAATLGCLALCVALWMFFEAVWGDLPMWLRLTVIVASPLALLAATDFASSRESVPYFTSLLAALSLVSLIAGMAVTGQMFAMNESPFGPTAWGAFALALAWRYPVRVPLFAGLLLLQFSIPLWVRFLTKTEGWDDPFRQPELFLPAAIALFAVSTRIRFGGTWRAAAMVAGYLALLILGEISRGAGQVSRSVFGIDSSFYVVAALVVSGCLIGLGIQRNWPETVYGSGVAFVAFLVFRMHRWLWDSVPAYVFFTLIGLQSLIMLVAFRRLRKALAPSEQPGGVS